MRWIHGGSRIAGAGLAAFLSLASACSDDHVSSSAGVFGAACVRAAEQKKIVVVDFFTTWCGPCKKLDEITWPDESVKQWIAENAIFVKVDAEKDVALASRFEVQGYPTILLAKSDGQVIDRIVGYKSPSEFLDAAKQALAGKDSLVRANAKVDAAPQDPMVRMERARALAEKGEKQQALDDYLWCYDHGCENSPAFVGVRVSFLVADIAALGRSYPPAMDALRTRRDAAEKASHSSDAAEGRRGAADLASLDRMLEAMKITFK